MFRFYSFVRTVGTQQAGFSVTSLSQTTGAGAHDKGNKIHRHLFHSTLRPSDCFDYTPLQRSNVNTSSRHKSPHLSRPRCRGSTSSLSTDHNTPRSWVLCETVIELPTRIVITNPAARETIVTGCVQSQNEITRNRKGER